MTTTTDRSGNAVVVVECGQPVSEGHEARGGEKVVQAGTAWGVNPSERKLKMINLTAVLVPVIGLAAAIGLLWGVAFDWVQLAIMGLMYLITAIGITVGFHRLATHKSFDTPGVVRYLLAVAGSMAAQGPVIRWCAEHRRHHQHSDTEGDPHSPHMSANGSWGEGLWATAKGAFHAHVGWLLREPAEGLAKYSVDLRKDRALVAANNQFPWLVLLGLLIPAAMGGFITMSWSGALLGFLWGGLVRVLMVHHITWSVNSVCHLWGSKPFESHDESRNNAVVGILAMGEGWHNNHHAFPTSARHGLRWWEIDMSYAFIRVLALLGLARNIRVPDAARIASKKTA
ncbi:MAG: fatty acid desaturase [Phycisphaerales bacterium]